MNRQDPDTVQYDNGGKGCWTLSLYWLRGWWSWASGWVINTPRSVQPTTSAGRHQTTKTHLSPQHTGNGQILEQRTKTDLNTVLTMFARIESIGSGHSREEQEFLVPLYTQTWANNRWRWIPLKTFACQALAGKPWQGRQCSCDLRRETAWRRLRLSASPRLIILRLCWPPFCPPPPPPLYSSIMSNSPRLFATILPQEGNFFANCPISVHPRWDLLWKCPLHIFFVGLSVAWSQVNICEKKDWTYRGWALNVDKKNWSSLAAN